MKKLLIILLMGMFLVSFVGAAVLPMKSFDDKIGDYGKVTIHNWNIIGKIFDLKLAELELKENTDTCGSSCSAETEIVMYQRGSLIDDVKFMTLQEDESWIKQDIKSYQFYIKTGEEVYDVDDFEYQCKEQEVYEPKNDTTYTEKYDCKNVKVGTHKETEKLWEEYTLGSEVETGTYEIKLEGEKKSSRTVDWQITSQGKLIDEWAVWGKNPNLIAYWTFDETTGDVIDVVNGLYNWTEVGTVPESSGVLDGSRGHTSVSNYFKQVKGTTDIMSSIENQNFTIAGWVYTKTARDHGPVWSNSRGSATQGFRVFNYYAGAEDRHIVLEINSGGTSKKDGVEGTDYIPSVENRWIHWALKRDGSNFTLFWNGSIIRNVTRTGVLNLSTAGTNAQFNLGYQLAIDQKYNENTYDDTGFWDKALTDAEIVNLFNSGEGKYYSEIQGNLIVLNSPENDYGPSINTIEFNATATQTVATISNMSLWTNQSGIFQQENVTTGLSGNTNETIWSHTIIGNGNYLWGVQACDSDGDCGFASENRTVNVDSTAPVITIISPTTPISYGYVNQNVTLNWSIVEAGTFDSVWYNHNSSNITVYGASNVSNFSIESYINNNITVYANDSVNNIGSTFYEWNYTLFENSKTYPTTTFETDTEYFIINLTYDDSIYLSMNGNLNHNGTNSVLTDTGSGSNVIFNSTIVIPVVTASGTMDFFWNVSLNDGATTTYITSPTYSHSVTALQLINITNTACPAGYFETANYTFKDANNLTDQNMSIDYNFEYGTGDSSSKELYGNFVDTDIFRICINETQGDYKLGYGEINYDSTGYVERRFYMFEEFPLSNETGNAYTLYNLPTASATSFIFEVKDAQLTPYNNKYLNLLRWYPELDEYKIVEAAYTDGDGKTVMKVKVEDVDYRVGVYERDGTLIQLAAAVRMACLVNPCTYTLQVDSAETDFFSVYDVESTLVYDSDNSRFVFTWNDASQATDSMRLDVYKETGLQSILICNSSATGYTGVMTCGTGTYSGNFYAVGYRTASPEKILITLWHSLSDAVDGDFGLFIGFILAMVVGLIGIFSPVASITLLIIGLIPVVIFGAINIAIFMGIVTLAGIIIHYLGKAKS